MNTEELIDGIRLYNPYCEHITLSTIYAKLGCGRFNVINCGSPGTGKSQSSIEILSALDTGEEIIIDNNTTKKGFFGLMMDFPNHNIVLDECSTLMKDKATQDAIKLAMEGKSISWIKDKSRQETPPFNGNFIINTNEQMMPSVIDRCFFNKTLMNKEMALNFIDYAGEEQNHDKLILHIKKKIANKKQVILTKEEKEKVIVFLKKHIEESDEGLEYSRRVLGRMLQYFKCSKKLFNKLDDKVLAFIEPFAALYVINEKAPELIEAIVSNGEIDKSELILKLSKEGNYSERHARRLVNEKIESRILISKGRMVTLK